MVRRFGFSLGVPLGTTSILWICLNLIFNFGCWKFGTLPVTKSRQYPSPTSNALLVAGGMPTPRHGFDEEHMSHLGEPSSSLTGLTAVEDVSLETGRLTRLQEISSVEGVHLGPFPVGITGFQELSTSVTDVPPPTTPTYNSHCLPGSNSYPDRGPLRFRAMQFPRQDGRNEISLRSPYTLTPFIFSSSKSRRTCMNIAGYWLRSSDTTIKEEEYSSSSEEEPVEEEPVESSGDWNDLTVATSLFLPFHITWLVQLANKLGNSRLEGAPYDQKSPFCTLLILELQRVFLGSVGRVEEDLLLETSPRQTDSYDIFTTVSLSHERGKYFLPSAMTLRSKKKRKRWRKHLNPGGTF